MLRLNSLFDISQERVLPKMQTYLLQNQRPNSAKSMNHGHCAGFTAAFLQGMWLQTTQLEWGLRRDGLRWLTRYLVTLSEWNENPASINDDDKKEIDYLIDKIQHWQDPFSIDNHARQGDFGKFMKNNKGALPRCEFSLAGSFRKGDLSRSINLHNPTKRRRQSVLLDVIAPINRMVHISSYDHSTGLFFNGNTYFFYDSGIQTGAIPFHSGEFHLIEAFIFNGGQYNEEGLFGFNTWSFDKQCQGHAYPSRKSILKKMRGDPFFTPDAHQEYNVLHHAEAINCPQSKDYYKHKIGNHPYFNLKQTARLGHYSLFRSNETCKPSSSPAVPAASGLSLPEL